MSIKNETFQACKSVWGIPYREEFRKLIRSLNSVSEDKMGTKLDRSHFGYVARHQYAQVLGYLMVHKNREAIERDMRSSIPPLDNAEKLLLDKVHAIFVNLNENFIKEITDALPATAKALNPYSIYDYSKKQVNTEVDVQKTFASLIDVVRSSSVVKSILGVPMGMVKCIPEGKYLESALIIIRDIQSRGVHDVPAEFGKIFHGPAQEESQKMVTRLLVLITALRQIISHINQLLFQAFLKNKLIVLSEDSIIQIQNYNFHAIGSGLTILAQMHKDNYPSEVSDVVLVKCPSRKIDEMCSIEGMQISSGEGGTIQYRLRVLDGDLNPYSGFKKI